jgi:hypothetical protein
MFGTTSVSLSTANQGLFLPIRPQRNMNIALLNWYSNTPSGNYDIGIFDNAGVRLWSHGSSAFPGGGIVTETVSPAVALVAGTQYWIGFTADNTTAAFRGCAVSHQGLTQLLDGTYWGRTVNAMFPLPAPATIGSTYATKFPLVVLREA